MSALSDILHKLGDLVHSVASEVEAAGVPVAPAVPAPVPEPAPAPEPGNDPGA